MTESDVKEFSIQTKDDSLRERCAWSMCERSVQARSVQERDQATQTCNSLTCLNPKEHLIWAVEKFSSIKKQLEKKRDEHDIRECIQDVTELLAKLESLTNKIKNLKKLGIELNFDSLPSIEDSIEACAGACAIDVEGPNLLNSNRACLETSQIKMQVVSKHSENSENVSFNLSDNDDNTHNVQKSNKSCSKEERTHTKAKELTENFPLEGVDLEKLPRLRKQQNTQTAAVTTTTATVPNACAQQIEHKQDANSLEDNVQNQHHQQPSELKQQVNLPKDNADDVQQQQQQQITHNLEADSLEQNTQQQQQQIELKPNVEPAPELQRFRKTSALPDSRHADIYSAPSSSSSSSSSSATCHRSQGARPKVVLQGRQHSVPGENTQQEQQPKSAQGTSKVQRRPDLLQDTEVEEEELYGSKSSDLTKCGTVPKAEEAKTEHLALEGQQIELPAGVRSKLQLQSDTHKYGTSAASLYLRNNLYDGERAHSVPEPPTYTKIFHEDPMSKSLDDFAVNCQRSSHKFRYQSFGTGGERPYYFGIPGLGPRKQKSKAMHSLPFDTNWPPKPPAPRRQYQWHSLYASNQKLPPEAAVGAASSVSDSLKSRNTSTSQNKMAAVAENDAISSLMTSSTRTSGSLQTDGPSAAAAPDTPVVSSLGEERIPDLPSRTGNMSKSASGRLVTDHASSTDLDLTSAGPKSRSNLPQGHDSIPSVSTTEPNNLESEANASNPDDLETDCSYVHVTHNDVREAVATGNTGNEPSRDQSAENVPEPMRNVDEEVAAPNMNVTNSNIENNENSTEAEHATQGDLEGSRSSTSTSRSMSSSVPLSGQSRRVLRAQRRARQRRNRNRSPSNLPPEGAGATNSDRSTSSPPPESASARNGTNATAQNTRNSRNAQLNHSQHEILQRFGIDPEEQDEEEEEVDLEEIRRENQRLKNAKLCQVCKDRDANRLFLPCAHLASCSLCSPALTKCPQCRSNIRGIVSVYFG